MSASTTLETAAESQELARTYQYDRYLTVLLLPRRHRPHLLALAAFAGELVRIPLITTEPMMARIRLQWWRDILTAAANPLSAPSSSGHPLADSLVETALECALPFGLLHGMIDAAETELDASPFPDTASVDLVLNKFDGTLFDLTGRVLGSQAPRDVWLEAARAYGYARLLEEWPWRTQGKLQTYAASDSPKSAVQEPRAQFAEMSGAALTAVQERYSSLDRAAQQALLPLATVRPRLKAHTTSLKQSDIATVEISDFARARALLWAYWRRQV